MSKVRVGIIFGGRSAEHEVSLQSARNIVDALDRSRFEPVLIGIDKTDNKLFPSPASDDVGTAKTRFEKFGDADEDIVSGLVAEGIVDRFKVVQINIYHG